MRWLTVIGLTVFFASACSKLGTDDGLQTVDLGQRSVPLALEVFFYPQKDTAVLCVNFTDIAPVATGTTIVVELAAANTRKPLQRQTLNIEALENEDEAEFSLKDLNPGAYVMRAVVNESNGKKSVQRIPFEYPFADRPPLIDPAKRIVARLPPAITPPRYKLQVSDGGGLEVTVKGQTYRVESSYSFPHGGENQLVAGPPNKEGEDTWQVSTPEEAPGRPIASRRRFAAFGPASCTRLR